MKTLAPNKTDPTNEENEYVLASYNFKDQENVLKLLNTAVDHWTVAVEDVRKFCIRLRA